MQRLRSTALRLVLSTLCTLGSLAVALTPQHAQSEIKLGGKSFAKPNAPALNNSTLLSAGLGSYGFVSGVGGVAFGAVAEGSRGLNVTALEYVPARTDGKRLQISFETATGRSLTVVPDLADWQLVPVARFAVGEQHACFTLFGQLTDREEERQRRNSGQRILNYHSAFVDTLLGLRLFQADILIIDPSACDLPQDAGRYILGPGEAPPNVRANELAYQNFQTFLTRQQGQKFRSYVICDQGQRVLFSVARRKLTFSGLPVWQCWRSPTMTPEQHRDLQVQANQTANDRIQGLFDADQGKLSAIEFNLKWTSEYQKKLHSEFFDQITTKRLLIQMPKETRSISAGVYEHGGINPTIYNALTTTMHYAALFRHFKASDAAAYAAFVEALKDVDPNPMVETPTVMYPLK